MVFLHCADRTWVSNKFEVVGWLVGWLVGFFFFFFFLNREGAGVKVPVLRCLPKESLNTAFTEKWTYKLKDAVLSIPC
jgi:hypothetical protein